MPLLHLLRQNPVIAAVKDNASLQLAIDSECQFISVLYGNICTISNIVITHAKYHVAQHRFLR